jgi:ATP-dependent DNA helicase UvrD/PcrA
MDERTRYEAEQAREAARQLLSAYRMAHPRWNSDRTPVDEIAAWLDLDIATFHPDDHPRGTYGFLEPEERLVWLCRDLSPTLRRFTLAHELGHAVLHRSVDEHAQPNLRALEAINRAVNEQAQPALGAQDAINRVPMGGDSAAGEDFCQVQDVREEVTGLLHQETAEELLGPGVSYDPHSQRELAANIFAAELLMPLERVRDLYLNQDIPAPRLATIFDVSNAALLNCLAGLLNEPDNLRGGDHVLDESALYRSPASVQSRYAIETRRGGRPQGIAPTKQGANL